MDVHDITYVNGDTRLSDTSCWGKESYARIYWDVVPLIAIRSTILPWPCWISVVGLTAIWFTIVAGIITIRWQFGKDNDVDVTTT